MKIAFVSNYLNHHQLFLCNHLMDKCEEFYFIATEPIPESRIKLGYDDMNSIYDYVIRIYENEDQKKYGHSIIKNYDVVIFGACPAKFINLRMRKNKLSFIYSERLLKKGLWRRYIPSTRRKIYERIIKYKDKNLYVLCASAYTSYDLSLCGFFNKCYKWGYFPELDKKDIKTLMENKNKDYNKLLCVGRLINGKCTKDAIFVAKRLMLNNVPFTMDIIGMGNYEKPLKLLVKLLGLTKKIRFLGSMPPEEVKKHMEAANIFIFTSNYKEGWGAVINEAMSCGCAIVASHAVGSVPYLIENKVNGFIYRSGNISELYYKVKHLIQDPDLQHEFGMKAYETMNHTWNADVAASRFLEFSGSLLVKKTKCYRNGPCSMAYIIEQDWFQ